MNLKGNLQMHHEHEAYTWWEYDGQGIPLAKVCEKCVDAVLAKYDPVVLGHYTQADVDEPIDEDY
jgi:hypothetical protein